MTPLLRRTLTLGVAAGVTTAAACVSTQQELQMGREYSAQINEQLPIVEDAAISRYINTLGSRIQRQPGNRDIPYRFFVVNSDQVNAFAVPGGYVYINRGLIERSETMSELAGVVGHEIGHVEARHSAEMLERMQAAQVGLALGSVLLGQQPEGVAGAAVQVGAAAYFSRHSREDELEADAIAVRLLPGVDIDPRGIETFFQKLLDDQERTPSALEQWFSTHPLTRERIDQVRRLIDRMDLPAGLQVHSRAYEDFKARVRALPPPPAETRR
jgi:predicted Zn-dependent protease